VPRRDGQVELTWINRVFKVILRRLLTHLATYVAWHIGGGGREDGRRRRRVRDTRRTSTLRDAITLQPASASQRAAADAKTEEMLGTGPRGGPLHQL